MKVHPVFQVSLLETAANDPLPGQRIEPPSPVRVDGEEVWEVDEILNSRLHYRPGQYKVKWEGFKNPVGNPQATSKTPLTELIPSTTVTRESLYHGI